MPMQFLHGIAAAGKTTAGYCMMQDFAPKKYHIMLGTMWSISEGIVGI